MESMEDNVEKLESEEGVARKPYERPQIVYQQSLEALAAFCDAGAGGKQGASCTLQFS